MSALCLSWSLRHWWFGLFLHWAFTAGLTWRLKKQHTECICLCFLLYFTLYPGPPSEKKNKKQNTNKKNRKPKQKSTQPTSGELISVWLSFPLLFRSLPALLPRQASRAGVQPRAGDLLWTFFVKHFAMCSLISTVSHLEIGVYLGWVTCWNSLMWCFPLPPFGEEFHLCIPTQKTNLWIAWVFLKSCTKMSH